MKRLVIIINIALFFVACGKKKTQDNAKTTQAVANENMVMLTPEQYKNAGIETGKLDTKNISSVLKLNGKIDVPPQNMISVSVPLGGYLKSTKLLPGMHIVKGDVLAVMEDPQYIQLQQDYLTAKAQFTFNESEYLRQKELNENKAASDKVFQQAQATYRSQQILINSLEQKLKLIGLNPEKVNSSNISRSINIYSPISGFVSAVNVNIGKYVTPSDVLFVLINPSDIHLNLTVFDKDIHKLSIGQKVIAYTNTYPDKKYDCEIILINKDISNENATQVHCHFKQYDKSLLPGMFMNADIEIAGSNTTVLSDDAIVRFNNKHYIFTTKDNKRFEMTEVQPGNSENGFTEILNGDKIGNNSIAVKGAYSLLMALKNVMDE
ncbi:MAG: efflux RND transporter periplasmic adaptor subunit [Bacteroidetes bacterium]|nr:efflux RND transporter periplasmic adaptor subunit [Bacteroidota bacterium]